MKTLILRVLMAGLAFASLYSCSTTENNASVPAEFEAKQLLSNTDKLNRILTADMVAKVGAVSKEKLQINYEDFSESVANQKLAYSWNSGKEIKVGGGKHAIAQYYSLGIANVQAMEETTFAQVMGSSAGLQKQVDALAKDTFLSKDLAMEQAAYLKAYAKEQKITAVKNVGNLAYWETPIQVLHVLANGVAFSITANFGGDEAQNKSKAIALANEIFNHKKG